MKLGFLQRFVTVISLVSACYLKNGTFLPDPAVGQLCIECKLLGYKFANGSCSTQVSYQPVATAPEITCPFGQCRVNGVCKDSQYGIICDECNKLGYLIGYTCECYPGIANKYQSCIHSQSVYQETLTIASEKYYKWYCDPFKNHEMGCFKLGLNPSDFRYGRDQFPPVPDRCCSNIYGPDPAQLVGPIGLREACNSFGGPDPNDPANPTFFYSCHNHGTWNQNTYKCTCAEPNWQASVIGLDIYGNPAYSCNKCKPGWGPLGQDMCGAIYAPSTRTGFPEICAGNGEMTNGACDCFQNATHGYWQLSPVSFASQVTNGAGITTPQNITVDVCAQCKFPYQGQDCLETPFCLTENCPQSYTAANETFYWANNSFPFPVVIDPFEPCDGLATKNALFKCQQTNCTHFFKTRRGLWEFFRNDSSVNSTVIYRTGKMYTPC